MNIEGLDQLSEHTVGDAGYVSSAPKEADGNYMAVGSTNVMLTGTGKTQAHKGVTQRTGGVKGGFVMNNVAETFASIGQTSDVTAYGNVANVFAALFYIGKGLVRLAGTSLVANASATLALLIKRNGSYTATVESGAFQAGLAAPSAPTIRAIAPPAGFTGKINGTVSVVIWRIRSTTGAVSNQSPVSNIVSAVNQSIVVTFPMLDANGQDAWGIGVTKQIEGRIGSHFEYTEIFDSVLTSAINRTDVSTKSAHAITAATNATPIQITTNTHGYATGDTVVIAGVGGNTAANGTWVVTVVDATNFTLNTSVGNAAYTSGGTATSAADRTITSNGLRTVSGATNATPIVITTSAAHNYATGDSITVAGVVGNTAANGTRIITVLTSTTFSLNGSVGNAAYTSGGTSDRSAGFTSSYIGWSVVLSGGATLTTYVTAVPSPTTLTLNAVPPTTATGVSMALSSAVEGTARSTVIEWRDGDLLNKPYAPFRSFPPPSALFMGTLEDVLFVDGAYADSVSFKTSTSNTARGTGLAPSEPGRPESFSPDTVIFTNDTPTALMRGDGVYWRFGRNTLHKVQYLGGEKPLSMEVVWESVGIQYQNQACLGEGGRLYLWPSNLGLLRMDGSGTPEGEFATSVKDDLIPCIDPSKRVLGWDGVSQVIAVCYDKTVWPYFTSLQRWGAPATLSAMGNIRSAVTENNQLLFTDANDDIWEYNVGTGSTATIQTPWRPSSASIDTIAAIVTSVRADNIANPVIIEVFADGDQTASVSSITVTPTRTGYQQLPTVWPNIAQCDSHSIRITFTSTTATGDCGLESISVLGQTSSILN